MGILDKVKNSKIAKTAARKANEYLNSDKNKNQNMDNNITTGSHTDVNRNMRNPKKRP